MSETYMIDWLVDQMRNQTLAKSAGVESGGSLKQLIEPLIEG
jgi:hypothetical protein